MRARDIALSPFDLSGRVILVTGASRGLGAAMAIAFAQAGASLILWARQVKKLDAVARTVEAYGHTALVQRVDVTRPAQVRRAFSQAMRRFGRLDVLVNNAGIWGGDPVTTLSLKTWSEVMATDLTAVFFVSQTVAPVMMRQRYGKILNLSSTSGILVHPEGAAYGSVKAAVMHLTRIMAVELGPHGVRVNSIAPGMFRTDMTADVFADREWVAKRQRRIPLRRFGEGNDLGGLAVFLASSASDHITGQTIVIDGGASLA